ncbi:MAG: hypothetical protein KDB23_23455, partial [Planctomycetales bacterium]|nr:hypothetical protein [Planctomycetales bacterium]
MEARQMMACDLAFDVNDLFADGGLLDQFQQTIDNAAYVGQQIPIIGEQLQNNLPFGVDVREELQSAYDTAAGAAEERLVQAFTEVFGEETYAVLDNVIDVNVDTEACTAEITVDLSRAISTWDVPGFQFDVGLRSLPIYAGADVGGVELEVGFDLSPIVIEVSESGVALDTEGVQLSLEASAHFADGAQFDAQVGFLQMQITDGIGTTPGPGDRSGLSLGVAVTFGPGFSVDPDDIQLSGQADLKLHMTGEANDNLPSVSADFVMHYDITSGDAPEVGFENVNVGLGDLVTKFLDPVVDVVEHVIEPLAFLSHILTDPIPVISDLGLGEVSVMDIANGLSSHGVLPADISAYITLIDAVTTITNFLDMLESADCEDCSQVNLALGSFSLSEANGDLRDLSDALDPDPINSSLSGISIGQFADLGGLVDRVDGLGLSPGATDLLVEALESIDESLSTGASISFPIIDNPASVIFQWLVGQNADVFRADASIALGKSDVSLGGNLPVGIHGGLQGGFSPSVKLGIGYDTFGLRRYLDNRHDGTESAVDLLDGFYITDESQIVVSGYLGPFIELSAAVFSVTFEGGIEAGIQADVIGSDEDPNLPDEDGEGDKVRFLSEMGPCAFSLAGSVDAYIRLIARLGVEIGSKFVGIEKRWDLADFQIASFDTSCVANPHYQPRGDEVALGEVVDGVLSLYAGPTKDSRSVASGVVNETFEILPVPGEPQSVQVTAFGVTQTFEDVTQIYADMGEGLDTVIIAADVTADVEIHGGDDADFLLSNGSGTTLFYGEDGNDTLRGGLGDSSLYGGDGDDTLTGSDSPSATTELNGNDGNDTLTARDGTSVLYGGAGLDILIGGRGANEVHGGIGDDTIYGGEGSNVLNGDAGDDSITSGSGSNLINGGADDDHIIIATSTASVTGGDGDDRLTWQYGAGSVTFDGEDGHDVVGMLGSAGDDTFVLSQQNGSLRVDSQGPTGLVVTVSDHVEEVSVDGLYGADQILVESLAGTRIETVSLNLSDNLARDGQEDRISIHATPL